MQRKRNKSIVRRIIIPAILLPLIITAMVVYFVDRHKTLYHFHIAVPESIYRSGTLSPRGLKMVLAMTKVKTIINLRSEGENTLLWHAREKEYAERHGIKMIDIPMEAGTPPAPKQLKEFFKIVENPAMLPVLIHCEAGVIRTGMILAAYKIKMLNQSNEKALSDQLALYPKHTFDPPVRNFIKTYKSLPQIWERNH